MTGSGSEFWPRNATLHRYTLPKCVLVAALSAHTASLSENSAEFCRDTMTGSIHAGFFPAIAPARSSVRHRGCLEPEKVCLPGKLEVRFP